MRGAIKECLFRVVEWTAHIDTFESLFRDSKLDRQCGRQRCAGENSGGLRPERFIEKFTNVDRRNAKNGELFTAFDPGHFAGFDLLKRIDVIDK